MPIKPNREKPDEKHLCTRPRMTKILSCSPPPVQFRPPAAFKSEKIPSLRSCHGKQGEPSAHTHPKCWKGKFHHPKARTKPTGNTLRLLQEGHKRLCSFSFLFLHNTKFPEQLEECGAPTLELLLQLPPHGSDVWEHQAQKNCRGSKAQIPKQEMGVLQLLPVVPRQQWNENSAFKMHSK